MPRTILYRNAHIATFDHAASGYGLLENHDLLVSDGLIAAIEPAGRLKAGEYDECTDTGGALITPALIDCHTHLVFGGSRADEWEMRQNGVPYQEIAAQGGGINSTVRATRASGEAELYRLAADRLAAFKREGVGLVEIKTGYGLNLETEAKTLRVAAALAQNEEVAVSRTLLSAHAVPPEFQGRSDEYLDTVISTIMPELWAQQAFECLDVFCENVGFGLAQTRRLFEAAQSLGIPVKGHTEQLSLQGGSALVAEYGGWSADHLEYLDEAGVQAMAEAGTVAVLLPGAYYFLRETQKPPVALLRRYGVKMAVATDFNPGTSPFASLRLAMNMACVLFGLTPLEAWQGVTVHAARALRREHEFGALSAGKPAHFNIWHARHPADIVYEPCRQFLSKRLMSGRETAF